MFLDRIAIAGLAWAAVHVLGRAKQDRVEAGPRPKPIPYVTRRRERTARQPHVETMRSESFADPADVRAPDAELLESMGMLDDVGGMLGGMR